MTNPDTRYHSEQRAVIEIKTKRLGEGLAFNVSGNLLQGNHFSQNYRMNGSYNYKDWDFFFLTIMIVERRIRILIFISRLKVILSGILLI